MYGLDLFSGIGGLTKALEGYVEPVAYCENDRYAQSVLLSRMRTGDIPTAPIWDDVQTLTRETLGDSPDIIYGGFPCQDISVAGRGAGLGGGRSGLFFEIVRLVSEIRPQFVFLENVSAITVRGAERVVGELCRLRYDCRWGILSAADVGAVHRRERWWLLARDRSAIQENLSRTNANGLGSYRTGINQYGEIELQDKQNGNPESLGEVLAHSKCSERWPLTKKWDESNGNDARRKETASGTRERSQDVADTSRDTKWRPWAPQGKQSRASRGRSSQSKEMGDSNSKRFSHRRQADKSPRYEHHAKTYTTTERSGGSWWSTEPNVGRVANGVPFRVDRLRGLGNAVVPAQAREAFERLMGLK